MLLMVWIARPVMMNATFSSFIIPCLGFMFLPFTTLMYVFLMQGVGQLQGLDWLWLFLAALLDIASIGAAGATNRNRIPAGVPGSTRRIRRRRRARRQFSRQPTRAGEWSAPSLSGVEQAVGIESLRARPDGAAYTCQVWQRGHHFRGVQDVALDRIGSDAHFAGVTNKSHSCIDIEMPR